MMDRKSEVLAALAPWLGGLLALAVGAILIMVGHDIGAGGERARVANECRAAGAFTVKRTGFLCEVRR